MADINFTSLTVGVILVAMLGLGMISFMTHVTGEVGVVANTTPMRSFVKMQEISNISQNINYQVTSDETSIGAVLDNLASQGVSSIKIGMMSIGLLKDILLDLSEYMGLPYWFVGCLIAIILVILSYLAITILMRAFQQL